jgi:hypothetical protein
MHVREDTAAVATDSFAPVPPLRRSLDLFAQKFSLRSMLLVLIYAKVQNSPDSQAPVLLLR